MKCIVYRSLSHPGAWLYSAKPIGELHLPDELAKLLGRTREIMAFDTKKVGRLVQVDRDVLAQALASRGYHLCLREPDEVEKMLDEKFGGTGKRGAGHS
ncbi:MAG: YcgL domain-containing protein [Succinivibrionaceae bacterium]|nr:YcgL domain-containing protein [Succinivibrionaceae bacterium]